MAYTFFPTSLSDITSRLSDFPETNISEIKALFSLLRNKVPSGTAPINIDLKKKANVNVSRAISDEMSLADIKTKAGLSIIKIKFGNGSSGNRGVNNRGNLFEPQFNEALQAWWAGENITDKNMLAAIKDLDKSYDLSNAKEFKTDVVGGENTRRPLVFSPSIQLSNTKGVGFDVGKSVTDITVTVDKKPIYLSLKLGGTTTFFNVGVKTVLTKSEIQNMKIENANGKKLLDLFGLDELEFCNVFNGNSKGKKVTGKRASPALINLLKSGIGYNYHIIHKMRGKILSKKMDQKAMTSAASVGGLTIFYGGKTGKGKRVDIEMSSSTYRFKLNFRDTQGGDGYPTRLMCDFNYK